MYSRNSLGKKTCKLLLICWFALHRVVLRTLPESREETCTLKPFGRCCSATNGCEHLRVVFSCPCRPKYYCQTNFDEIEESCLLVCHFYLPKEKSDIYFGPPCCLRLSWRLGPPRYLGASPAEPIRA